MEIRNNSKDSTYDLLKKGLDAATTRGKVIANNIANYNTKGYKRFNVSFEDSFSDAKDRLGVETTNKMHIAPRKKEEGAVKIEQDNSTSMRADGNNVDVENESANEAANTLMYNALITRLNSKISLQRYIIKDGRG